MHHCHSPRHEMGDPHGPEHGDAHEAELNADGESLIVRIGRDLAGGASVPPQRTSHRGNGSFPFRARAPAPVK